MNALPAPRLLPTSDLPAGGLFRGWQRALAVSVGAVGGSLLSAFVDFR